MIGLREYDEGERSPFDPTRVGLDHLAFAVPITDLQAWEQRFADLGVAYDPGTEHALRLRPEFQGPRRDRLAADRGQDVRRRPTRNCKGKRTCRRPGGRRFAARAI